MDLLDKIKLFGDKILVLVDEPKRETESGIIIAENHLTKPQMGTVAAVGTGRITNTGTIVPVNLNINDRILFEKFAGQEIKILDTTYLLLSEQEVILKFK